jgi:hypothetical protein
MPAEDPLGKNLLIFVSELGSRGKRTNKNPWKTKKKSVKNEQKLFPFHSIFTIFYHRPYIFPDNKTHNIFFKSGKIVQKWGKHKIFGRLLSWLGYLKIFFFVFFLKFLNFIISVVLALGLTFFGL